jgi:heme-degrading monooxygenase HmoA
MDDWTVVALSTQLRQVRQRVFRTRGFRDFTVHQGVERPFVYLAQVWWETPEELIDFTESGRFQCCWAPVQPRLAAPPAVDHFVERPGPAFQGPGVIMDPDWLTD